MSADPLYELYRRLLATVTNDEGYGGPVAHVAETDGWRLRIATSDFGDLMVSARSKDGTGPLIGFEYVGDEREPAWTPFTTTTRDRDLPWLVGMFGGVEEWHDTIERRASASTSFQREDA